MHKHLKSSVTAALVAGGLVGLAAQPAHADSLLFPYLNTSVGTYSFVTIVNDGFVENTAITGYHFTYEHKPNPVVQRRGCNHFDFDVGTTPADMMTFEVAGKVLDPAGMVLFESGGDAGGWGVGGLTSGGVLPLTSGQTAYLIVEPLAAIGVPLPTVVDGAARSWGWAEIIDTAANLNLGYSTHNFSNDVNSNPDFANISGAWTAWTWYPTAFVTTSWHVLPLGTRSNMSAATGAGGMRGAIEAWDGLAANAGGYDRDERRYSGANRKTVRCFAIVNRGNLLQPGVISATDNGGWMYVGPAGAAVATSATDPDDPSATYAPMGDNLVHKIQAATAAAGVGVRQIISREPSWDGFPYTP